jgi:hypothetical protein
MSNMTPKYRSCQLLLKRYRPILVSVAVFVAVGFLGFWLVTRLWFQFRYGAFIPPGVSGSTQVISVSWQAPDGVPKSYSRIVREYFGLYYSSYDRYGNWWSCFPKSLMDTLDEYGANVRDDKLWDASGREIRVIRKWRSDSSRSQWSDRRLRLVMENYTVIVLDLPEDE